MRSEHYWLLTVTLSLVLLGTFAVIRRFWPTKSEEEATEYRAREERRLANQEKAFSQFDPDTVLCRIKGCREPATKPLLMVVACKDRLGEEGRLHGRIPRLKVKERKTEDGDPINGYCDSCGGQAREHYEAVITEARAAAVRANTEIFDRISAMNRGGVDREIEITSGEAPSEAAAPFSLPELAQE